MTRPEHRTDPDHEAWEAEVSTRKTFAVGRITAGAAEVTLVRGRRGPVPAPIEGPWRLCAFVRTPVGPPGSATPRTAQEPGALAASGADLAPHPPAELRRREGPGRDRPTVH